MVFTEPYNEIAHVMESRSLCRPSAKHELNQTHLYNDYEVSVKTAIWLNKYVALSKFKIPSVCVWQEKCSKKWGHKAKMVVTC